MKAAPILALLASCACTTHVKLTVRNPQPVAQDVTVNILDDHSIRTSSLALGRVAADGGQVNQEFDVRHGYQLQITGTLPGGVQASPSPPRTVNSSPDPFVYSWDLELPQYLSDDAAEGTIQASFERLGPKIPGFDPISVDNALATWFGALIVVPVDPQTHIPTGDTLLFHLPPGQFGPSNTTAPFRYPPGSRHETIRITNTGAARAAAQFAGFGLAVEGETGDVLEIEWLIDGYGVVQREDRNWNYIEGFNQLSPVLKQALFRALADNPSSQVIYIDKLYVINQATFNIKEARRLAAGMQLNALSIVTASGTYSFESTTARTKTRFTSVLNVGGIPVNIQIIEPASGGKTRVRDLVPRRVTGSLQPPPPTPPNWKTVTLIPQFERASVLVRLPSK